LYSAQEHEAVQTAQKDDSASQTWMLPVFGLVGMLSFAAGIGASNLRRSRVREVHQVDRMDEEALLE